MASAVLGGSSDLQGTLRADGVSIGFRVAGAIFGGSRPELHTAWRVDDVSTGFGVAGIVVGASPELQRTGRSEGVRVNLAWQASYS